MGILTYPRSIWTPQPYWARQRNAAGQRIRVDGARMNDTECCCGPSGDVECSECGGTGENAASQVTLTVEGITSDPTGYCNVTRTCDVANATYALDYDISGTFTPGCWWIYNFQELYCVNDNGSQNIVGCLSSASVQVYNGKILARVNSKDASSASPGPTSCPAAGGGSAWSRWELEVDPINCVDGSYELSPVLSDSASCIFSASSATVTFG